MAWDAMNARWNEWILAYGPENQEKFMEWLGMDDPDWRQMMLTLIAIIVGLIALISLHLVLRYKPPRKDEAARLYRKFVGAAGIVAHTGESPLAYSSRLTHEKASIADQATDITRLYLNTRYGPPDPTAIPELRAAVSGFPARS
jgi:hypothetical protein